MQPVENTDNSADSGDNTRTDRVCSSTGGVAGRPERVNNRAKRVTTHTRGGSFGTLVDNRNQDSNTWMANAGYIGATIDNDRVTVGKSNVHEGQESDRRGYNADQTFFSMVQKELQVTSKPTHSRETLGTRQSEKQLYQTSRSSSDKKDHSMNKQGTSMDIEHSSKIVRIPCGDQATDEVTTSETMDKLGSARQDYNKHMQMLIERLAAHKFSKPGMEPVVPKPPSRPRSAKRPVSAQRMSR